MLLAAVGWTGIDDDAGASFVGGRRRRGVWMVLLPNYIVNMWSLEDVEGLVHLLEDITVFVAGWINGVEVTCCWKA